MERSSFSPVIPIHVREEEAFDSSQHQILAQRHDVMGEQRAGQGRAEEGEKEEEEEECSPQRCAALQLHLRGVLRGAGMGSPLHLRGDALKLPGRDPVWTKPKLSGSAGWVWCEAGEGGDELWFSSVADLVIAVGAGTAL